MRIQMKKLMSFLLAVGILAGSLKFSGKVFAADDTFKITLNGNGGKFNGGVSDNYNPGDALPGYEAITRDNLIFAGWYDNTEFTGNPVYSVPAGASGDITYYAKWITQNTLYYDGFEKDKGLYDWSSGTTLSVNTDKENVYSGEKSIKYEIPANAAGNLAQTDGTMIEGDGVYFWIKTERATTLYLQFKKSSSIVSSDITVPAGKSIVAVPWMDIKNIASQGEWAGAIQIMIKSSDNSNTVYIDNIATYNSCKAISFKLNGGKFLNDAPLDYSPGMVLPTYEDITRKGYMFAGWYDNAEFTGSPVYSVPAGASGDITYYAKWVKPYTVFDNFDDESVSKSWKDNAKATDNDLTPNIDADNSYSGEKALKYQVSSEWGGYVFTSNSFHIDGDGIYFWIKTEKDITVKLKLNYSKINTNTIGVPAGKSFVFVPWSIFGDKLDGITDLWAFQIDITAAVGDVVYLDDIGTYSDSRNISFELNEGKFSNDVPEKYYIGDTLPNYENIIKGNLIFAGWYDNAEFMGNPVYSVPAGASDGITYYAKWVKQYSLTYNFDIMNWVDWSGNVSISASTDAENAYSGNTSMKYVIPKETIGNMCAMDGLMYEGDGIYFWIKAEKATTLQLQFNGSGNIISEKITVAAGKNFVAIPWPKTVTPDSNGWAGSLQIIVDKAAEDNTVYIDDVGTYSNAGAHAFANGTCSECGAVEFDYNGDKECDIRDLVRLKRYLTDDSVDIEKSNDDNGTVENNDLVKLQKRLLGIS